jgi:hypothetical protein
LQPDLKEKGKNKFSEHLSMSKEVWQVFTYKKMRKNKRKRKKKKEKIKVVEKKPTKVLLAPRVPQWDFFLQP